MVLGDLLFIKANVRNRQNVAKYCLKSDAQVLWKLSEGFQENTLGGVIFG